MKILSNKEVKIVKIVSLFSSNDILFYDFAIILITYVASEGSFDSQRRVFKL